jgi:hypothetical protein
MNDRINTIATAGGGWRALCAGLLLFFCAGLALANPSDKLVIDGGWRFHLLRRTPTSCHGAPPRCRAPCTLTCWPMA